MDLTGIVVVGASSGGLDPLRELVSGLAPELTAAVVIVRHGWRDNADALPQILGAVSPIPVRHAEDGAALRPAMVMLAPPDNHLVVERGHAHLSHGPKENYQRPSINVTFRSAALAYGPQTVGVVLSGELDDGAAGLWEIKRRGGIAIVQHPEEAAYPSMPLSALRDVEVDHVVRTSSLAQTVLRATITANGDRSPRTFVEEGPTQAPTRFSCPDCLGAIHEERQGNLLSYACRIGHRFSPLSMIAGHSLREENALWSAAALLEEGAELAEKFSVRAGMSEGEHFLLEAAKKRREAQEIREILMRRQSVKMVSLDE